MKYMIIILIFIFTGCGCNSSSGKNGQKYYEMMRNK